MWPQIRVHRSVWPHLSGDRTWGSWNINPGRFPIQIPTLLVLGSKEFSLFLMIFRLLNQCRLRLWTSKDVYALSNRHFVACKNCSEFHTLIFYWNACQSCRLWFPANDKTLSEQKTYGWRRRCAERECWQRRRWREEWWWKAEDVEMRNSAARSGTSRLTAPNPAVQPSDIHQD